MKLTQDQYKSNGREASNRMLMKLTQDQYKSDGREASNRMLMKLTPGKKLLKNSLHDFVTHVKNFSSVKSFGQ